MRGLLSLLGLIATALPFVAAEINQLGDVTATTSGYWRGRSLWKNSRGCLSNGPDDLTSSTLSSAPHILSETQINFSIEHDGISPTITNGANWTVFRNVLDYGAKGDGVTDDSAAIQAAINFGNSAGTRNTGSVFGSTGQPAVVYFPSGTYLVGSSLQNYIGTVLMGDPTNRPVIKASSSFSATTLLNGVDPRYPGLVAFYHEIKNLVFDSTAVGTGKSITLLSWAVSQGCQLSNVQFNMPVGATGHTGVSTGTGSASPLIINDLQFFGGGVGVALSVTQYHLKNLYFKSVKISILLQGTGQGLRFEGCTVGIDTTSGGSGLFNLIDSSATNTPTLISAASITTTQGSLNLENVIVDSTVTATVKVGSTALLTGSVTSGTTWTRGHVYTTASLTPNTSAGTKLTTSRPAGLLNSTGFYQTVTPPTYAEYNISQVINVKDVSGYPVAGDGVTDDTASLQAILNSAAGNSVLYFPYGVYLLTNTLLIPTGSRLYGEAFTQFSASGSKFSNVNSPTPMLKVGNAGDVGVAQLTDFVFTVAQILPGAVLVEVNMAGPNAGDVGFFNCHFRIGGAHGSTVDSSTCGTPSSCLAARISAHLTATSSSYWENSWAWVADHDLDGSTTQTPAPGGGFLVEATGGTWFLGLGIEHHTLYQMAISGAKNVFLGLQEGEAAYWQGSGNTLLAPAPFTASLLASEPSWSWCGSSDAVCRMGLYQSITNSSNINIYSAGFWNFVSGPSRAFCATDCQDNAVLYENNSKMFVYGISTINSRTAILESGVGGDKDFAEVNRMANSGSIFGGTFATGIVAGYLRQSA